MKYGFLLRMASLITLSTNAYGQGGSTLGYDDRIFVQGGSTLGYDDRIFVRFTDKIGI